MYAYLEKATPRKLVAWLHDNGWKQTHQTSSRPENQRTTWSDNVMDAPGAYLLGYNEPHHVVETHPGGKPVHVFANKDNAVKYARQATHNGKGAHAVQSYSFPKK